MHLEQAILAGLRVLVPDLDGLTACKTGALRCSAPRGRQSVGLHLQAADRTRDIRRCAWGVTPTLAGAR